jgi:porin
MKIVRGAGACILLSFTVARGADVPLVAPPLSLDPPSQEHAGPSPFSTPKESNPPSTNYGITGDWFGQRSGLEDRKIYVEGYALLDVSKNFRGGIDTENYMVRSLLDLHVAADLGALGLAGGMAYVDVQWHDQTNNVDSIVGDIQAYDNLEGPRYVALEQFWYKQDLGNDLRLKIGRIDANSDAGLPGDDAIDGFSLLEHGREFLHSAASSQPTVFVMPTFPNPAPGVQLFYGKAEGFYLGAGAYYSNSRQTFLNISGHPETAFFSTGGVMLMTETGARWKWDGKAGHAGVGGWYHTGNFPSVRDPGMMHRGAGGGYFLIDQTLYHELEGEETTREVGAFLTGGIADAGASPMTHQLGLGIMARGFVPARPEDSLGVMSSWVQLAGPREEPLQRPGEWATEVYYKVQLTSWASLTPSFAYITSPSGLHPDAAETTLRLEIDF